jgi:putative photosynthetic complex assembly protein
MSVTQPDAPRRRRQPPDAAERERMQRIAVWLMLGLVMLTLASVTIYRLSGAEPIAQPPTTAIAAERLIVLERPERNGPVLARDAETGALLARSNENKNGFLDTIGRVIDRQRLVDGTTPDAPLRVVRFDSGRISLIDAESGRRIEITGHGSERRRRARSKCRIDLTACTRMSGSTTAQSSIPATRWRCMARR